jgi:drug/metabolite transporter (DMT)-like permease
MKLPSLVIVAVGTSLLLWASTFAAIHIGLQAYAPGQLALLRFLIASVALLAYGLITRLPMPDLEDLPAFTLLGLSGFTVYHIAQNSGQQSLSAGTTSLLIASTPIFTALMSRAFLGERLSPFGWLGIGVSIAGVGLTSLSAKGGLAFEPAAILILIAALSSSIYFVLQKPYLSKYTGLQLTTFTIWAGTLFMFVYAPGLVDQIQAAPLGTTLTVGYLGIFPTALGYVLWSYALARANVSTVTSTLNLLPLLSLLIAWLWLGEIPSVLALAGGFTTLAGVILLTSLGKSTAAANQLDYETSQI